MKAIESEMMPYQLRWIYDCPTNPNLNPQERKKFLLCDKAVRVGLSFAQAWKSLKKRLLRSSTNPLNEVFASKNLKVAGEYMTYLKRFGDAIHQTCPGLLDLSSWTSEIARLKGGNIYIVSSDPNAFRGMGADITLDEFDFHEQQAALYAAASSRVNWLQDGQVSIFSSRSANPATFFAHLADDVRNGKMPAFNYHRVTLDDAVGQGLAEKVPGAHQRHLNGTPEGIEKCRREFLVYLRGQCASDEDFRREYYCDR